MQKELDLAKKPQRPTFQKEVEKSRERAYERAFKETAKQVAQAEGAAAGAAAASSTTADPIVEAARQRALAPQQPVAGSPNPPVGRVQPKPSGELIQRPDGSRVPREYYDLGDEQKARFDQLLKEGAAEEQNESLALQYSKSLGDQVAELAKRLTAVERENTEKDAVILGLVRLVEQKNTNIEVAKSDELTEQQTLLAQMSINLQGIGAEQEANHQRRLAESEQQAADHQERMAAIEQEVSTLVGTVKSTVVLMGERSNAVINAVATVEPKVQRLGVQLVELENRTDALGSPITRAEMKADITTAVTEELKAQSSRIVDEAIETVKADEFAGGSIFGQRRDGDYIRQKRADADQMQNIR